MLLLNTSTVGSIGSGVGTGAGVTGVTGGTVVGDDASPLAGGDGFVDTAVTVIFAIPFLLLSVVDVAVIV
ncbi:hypothetical protein RE628_00880 [Paenibacillus sp. D2_2]|uniref:hypothetical protein n=1 Tax=Paenibacillus sp. D2_2 TaxID=3073092 RepID=UPI0028153C22|nr:hypothetical protein [Paenibacillus sp. D2_2]WMT41207.1 hypothetical protein RE628_00880 [Paenibacillus sp. D2_2]